MDRAIILLSKGNGGAYRGRANVWPTGPERHDEDDVFSGSCSTSSLHADPQDLLGKRLHDFAGKCKIKYSTDRSRGPMVCRVKGQPRYFGKIKISEEYLYFDDDRVVQVKVVPGQQHERFRLR